MARPAPEKLTKEQKELLKDPRFMLAVKSVKPVYRARKQKNSTRG